jgi:putative ABC transport system permease protein
MTHVPLWCERFWRECRYSARSLRRAPGFSTVAIVTLALGIGATCLMWSVLYGVLLRPLPYADPGRLVLVERFQDFSGVDRPRPSYFFASEARTWAEAMPSLSASALYISDVDTLPGPGGAELLPSAVVSDTFFSVLEGPLAAGRPIGAADGNSDVAVVSTRLAERLFGNAPAAVGRPLALASKVYTVIGVASPDFQFPNPATDLWLPIGSQAPRTRTCCFQMIGRLKAEESLGHAAAQASAVAALSPRAVPGAKSDKHAVVASLHDDLVGSVRPALLVLLTAVGLMLLVACVNVLNLSFARQIDRARETALRAAMGASPGQVAAPAVTEGLLIAITGAGLGVALASLGSRLVAHATLVGVPRLDAVRLDWLTFAVSAALGTLVAVGVSLVPLLQAGRVDPMTGLRGASVAGGGPKTRRWLCIAELAVSLVLLVGAGLLARSLVRLLETDLGVRTDHVVTMSVNTFGPRPTDDQTVALMAPVLEHLAAAPGVRVVGLGTAVPPAVSRMRVSLHRDGESVDYMADLVAASPGYFQALGMRLLAGRWFTTADDAQHSPVMIMTTNTARRFFGEGNPIGQTLVLPTMRDGARGSARVALVGVVANVRYSGLLLTPDDVVYRPFAQQVWVAPFVVARTTLPADGLVDVFRREIATVNPHLVVADARTLDERLADAVAQPRLRASVLVGVAGLALVLAMVGLSGVVAHSVSLRTKEFGVRMALGADRVAILTLVLGESVRTAVAGVAIGLVAAYALTRLLTSVLYGVSPTDGVSFAAAAATLFVVAVASAYGPARRATAVDPLVALRQD